MSTHQLDEYNLLRLDIFANKVSVEDHTLSLAVSAAEEKAFPLCTLLVLAISCKQIQETTEVGTMQKWLQNTQLITTKAKETL